MESGMTKFEEFIIETRERLAKIDARLEHTATKSDLLDLKVEMAELEMAALRTELHKGFADMSKWMVGIAIVLGASAITVMTFVLNNAVPKPAPAPPAPIVIFPPAPPASAPAVAAPAKR
jgi:hypothetical protein